MLYTVNNNADDVNPVIRAAAHFRWHLDLTNPIHTLRDNVELHFFEVRREEGTWHTGKNLNVAGKVCISEDLTKMYAFKVVNKSQLSLYPSLFYFDNNNFEICECLCTIESK